MDYFKTQKPEFLFLHLDLVDNAGHKYGWGSHEYLEAVEKTDRMVGQVRALVESMGLKGSTTILLTADHGGKGKGHGGLTMVETEIPWIIIGNGVRQDHEITDQIMQYDTTATMAHVLHLQPSLAGEDGSSLPLSRNDQANGLLTVIPVIAGMRLTG